MEITQSVGLDYHTFEDITIDYAYLPYVEFSSSVETEVELLTSGVYDNEIAVPQMHDSIIKILTYENITCDSETLMEAFLLYLL